MSHPLDRLRDCLNLDWRKALAYLQAHDARLATLTERQQQAVRLALTERVTILTGDTLTMDIIKALSLGAFEYWVKPIEARVLESGLRRALTARKAHPGRRFPH